jgi:hypothetical protein
MTATRAAVECDLDVLGHCTDSSKGIVYPICIRYDGHIFFSKGEYSEVGEHLAQRANMPALAPRTC